MSNLIEELKQDHKVLFQILNEVKLLGTSQKGGQDKLLAAKQIFLNHLKKEDEQLYPVLNKAAEKDPNLKRVLEVFARDMDEISQFTIQYFDRYSQDEIGSDFARDTGKLFAIIQSRVQKEEISLYPKFEKLGV